ncbi:retrovirus-related pol polyprotein from transposon TNT 1-94 [Tanacetum coccineum]|uniref:Retrovirus-related pol polyprotein from transposon TNT 1-94 n=1 Tax=Tanacetum coccineum TaxID=301880 RepID=A0ABQ4YE39_9ASTR
MGQQHFLRFFKLLEIVWGSTQAEHPGGNSLSDCSLSDDFEISKPPRDKNQRALVGGSWSDSGEEDNEKIQDKTCLVAQAPNEVRSGSSYFSDEIDDLALDNEYDKLCKMSLKIITKNKRLKAIRNSLENELRELKDKLSTLEKNKGVDIDCAKCHTLKIENEKLKEESTRLNKFEKSSSSGTKEIKFVKAQKKTSSDGGPINMGGPLNVQAAPKINMGPPPATPGSEKSVSFQKSILGPRPKHIIVNKVKIPVASDNEVKQFYKPLTKPGVGFSKTNFRSKTPPPRRVNNNYSRPKTPQPKRHVGRQNQPHGFPICLGVDLEPDEWIKDSGCSKHMTGNRKLFSTYKAYNGGNVIFGSNLRGNIIGKGTISNDSLKIDNVEHVDNLGFNLLSIGQICDNKCRVTFSEHDSEITKDGKVIGRGIRKKGLYVMKLGNKPKDKICLATIDENSTLWHRRLGHANMRLIQSLASKELVRNLPKLKFDQHFCDACKIGKQAHVSHKAKNIVSTTRCLELLHMDLFGPSAVRSYGGNRYTLVIVDDYSRYTWTRFLKDKTEAFDQFEIFSKKIQNQLGCTIVSIRTDHGREFDNEVQFGEFCNANGITHNFSAPRTPQSNGVVERKNRTLQEMSRTMLNEQSLPQKFWCNAVDTSTYILNRILIRAILGKTPYEILRGRKPTLDYFRVFGSKCFILNTKDYLTKFDPKSYEGVFLGYSQNSKAYIILNKHTRKIEESLNVTFDETPPPSKTSPLVDDDLDEEEAIREIEKKNLENVVEDETLEIDEIVNIKESRNHPLENVIGNLNQRTLRSQAQNQSNFYCFISTIEPKNVNEALGDESWIVAMQEELNQFIANDVWELVPQPKNMTIIGTKKTNGCLGLIRRDGIDSRNKARHIYSFDFSDMCDEFDKITHDEFEMSMMGELNLFLGLKIKQMEDVKSTRYIKGTTHLGLWYPKGTGIETVVYADSDHAGDYVDRKSTSGICTFVGCCLTSWFSKKQTALAISTTEAEYVSAGKACQQALWMKQALIDYDVRLDDVPIMCDNKGAIDLSKNPVQHSRTKHIEIRHHFLRDNVQKGHILIEKVPSVDNIADILTKPLKRESFNYLHLSSKPSEHSSRISCSKGVNATDLLNQGWQQDFEDFTRCEPSAYRQNEVNALKENRTANCMMKYFMSIQIVNVKMQSHDIPGSIQFKQLDDKLLTLCKGQEEKVDMRGAVDLGWLSQKAVEQSPTRQDTSSSSRNYTHTSVDAHTEQSEPSQEHTSVGNLLIAIPLLFNKYCHGRRELTRMLLLKIELLQTKDMV